MSRASQGRGRPEKPAPASRAPGLLLAALVASALAVAVYANSLGNELVYDDLGVIALNRAVRGPVDLRAIFLAPSWFAVPSKEHRPITTLSFALDHAAHGLRPFGYHLVNVVAHAAVSALVVVLAARVGVPVAGAGVAGALFAVHPIHTEAVAYAVGRAEILAALFALAALIVARSVATARRAALAVVAVAMLYGLALASKEHAIALVALVPLADLLVDDDGSGRRLGGRRLALYLTLVGVTAGYLVLRRVALGNLIGEGGFVPTSFWQNPAASLAWWQRVLTAGKVEARALGLLVLPLFLSADYSYRQLPAATSLGEPGALLGVAVLALVVAAVAFLWTSRRRAAAFLLLLAWLTYLPVSNLPFPIGTIFAERLLYLPSVGFCALCGLALGPAVGRRDPVALAGVGLLVVCWSGLTVARNRVWHDDLVFARAAVASAPESTQSHRLLAYALAQRAKNDDALAEYRKALDIYPDNGMALGDVCEILRQTGRPAEALPACKRAAELEAGRPDVWTRVGAVENATGDFAGALAAADKALALAADLPAALAVRGFALRGLERPVEARADFERALARAPALEDAYTGLAALAVDAGDYEGSARVFERMVEAAPSPSAYLGVVRSYQKAGREADAARALDAARRRFPNDPRLR